MNILLVTPAPSGSVLGNRITADRWARFLEELGHRVAVATEDIGQERDLLIALHARKSHPAILCHAEANPGKPLVLALTGTDVYDDIHTCAEARQSLELANRIVVLQSLARDELSPHLRARVRVIHQSVDPSQNREEARQDLFEVCVMGHLRPVKDPLRTALAAQMLPASSLIQVLHLGGALSDEMQQAALEEQQHNPRYCWYGEKPRCQSMRILSRCRLLVLTSRLEGGANVIGEAITLGVPVLSSRIPGSVGLLGEDYPGYFPFGDTQALADLLHRAEKDAAFYETLKERCDRLRPLFDPAKERESWRCLLEELQEPGSVHPG